MSPGGELTEHVPGPESDPQHGKRNEVNSSKYLHIEPDQESPVTFSEREREGKESWRLILQVETPAQSKDREPEPGSRATCTPPAPPKEPLSTPPLGFTVFHSESIIYDSTTELW